MIALAHIPDYVQWLVLDECVLVKDKTEKQTMASNDIKLHKMTYRKRSRRAGSVTRGLRYKRPSPHFRSDFIKTKKDNKQTIKQTNKQFIYSKYNNCIYKHIRTHTDRGVITSQIQFSVNQTIECQMPKTCT